MEVNNENLQLLAGYLQQTLSPDPNVRRPGKLFKCDNLYSMKVFIYIFQYFNPHFCS